MGLHSRFKRYNTIHDKDDGTEPQTLSNWNKRNNFCVYYTSGIPYNLIASPFAFGWFTPSRAGITIGIHIIRYCF